MHATVRGGALLGALLLIIVTFGLGGTAFADPGNGQGVGNGADNARSGSGSASTATADNSASGSPKSSSRGSEPTSRATKSQSQKGQSTKSQSQKGQSQKGQSQKSSPSTTSSGKADHSQGNAGTSGTWNQRQPNSGADDNPGGANGQCADYEGVYCSTRDGSASENGNNVGKSTGRPCAGCVGRADNKNPQGQKPDAKRDGNNGYECDGNNGIAKGNPAHTMCKPGDNVVERCPDGSALPAGGLADCAPPPPTCPDDQVLVDGTCVEGEGGGNVVPPLPDIAGIEDFAPRPRPNAEVLGVQATAAAPAVLPATGSRAGMGLLTGAGFLLLAAGAGLMMRRRPVLG